MLRRIEYVAENAVYVELNHLAFVSSLILGEFQIQKTKLMSKTLDMASVLGGKVGESLNN